MWFYIDPGTGSMLFTILIGVISAGVYALRNSIVKLRFILSGGRQRESADDTLPFAIFSDSKRYWNVFEPICDEFERRGLRLGYFTASPDDPALDKSYEHVECKFAGEGNRAFALMNTLKADIVLSTTPGLDVYQWKRSRDVKYYVHVPHAVSDITLYRMFGIDYYDALLLNADFQAEQVRALESARKLPEKELVIVGSTHMDGLASQLAAADPIDEHETTVLLAPSWGKSAILSQYGSSFIDALLETGYHIVIRPHPQSFTSEADLIEALMTAYPESDRLEWNRDNNNFEALRRADIMISDFSGVIMDYSLTFERPVIYTEPNIDEAPYDACWLDEELWTYKALPKIGRQLGDQNAESIKDLIDDCLDDEGLRASIKQVKSEAWRYQGEASTRIVDYLENKQCELTSSSADSDGQNRSGEQ